MEINAQAPIVARHQILIEAPLESVWDALTQISAWPDWNPDITTARIEGPVQDGAVIHWETAGMAIPSTIGELTPLKKLAWSGETSGILGIHIWMLSATADGTHVRTEESWEGALPLHTKELQSALDASLVRWLSYLKRRAESLSQ